VNTHQEIFEEASNAARAAVKLETDRLNAKYPGTHYDHHGCCGFAWVTIVPAREPFVTWCKKQTGREYGSKAYGDGWQFWSPGYSGQSLDIKEIGAHAFAEVLKKYGLDACVGSRMD
jgi:hypothetical protein